MIVICLVIVVGYVEDVNVQIQVFVVIKICIVVFNVQGYEIFYESV